MFGKEQCSAMGGREAGTWLQICDWGAPSFIMQGNEHLGMTEQLASLAICGEVDLPFCPVPQRTQQCPPCCSRRQGVDCKSSAWSKSMQHHWHNIDLCRPSWDYPMHRLVQVAADNPILSAAFPVSSHYRCSNLTIPTFILLQWDFFI